MRHLTNGAIPRVCLGSKGKPDLCTPSPATFKSASKPQGGFDKMQPYKENENSWHTLTQCYCSFHYTPRPAHIL
jgi:hypothetical protein